MNIENTFPKNYDDARTQFIQAARAVSQRYPSARLKSFNVPSQKTDDLYVDELFMPADSGHAAANSSGSVENKLLILTSGIHGLEASLGSAVQLQFMREILPTAAEKGIAVWIVHCLNPYGFKFGRRTTEHNVNLNRNFATTHATPNEGYKKLAPHFEKPVAVRNTFAHPIKTLAFIFQKLMSKEFNERTLSQAISQGQFTNEKGLEYGGQGPTPQTQYFNQRFGEIQTPFEEIVLIDLHTGLGKVNRLHLLTGFDVKKCVHPETFERLFQTENETALYEFNSGDEKGFYQTVGDINTRVAESAHHKKVVALTFEFGTLGNGVMSKAESLSRLWLENQGHFHGYKTKAAEEKTKQRFKDLFEPQDPAWQTNALTITRKVLTNLVERL